MHWYLCTCQGSPIFAWHHLMFEMAASEFTPSQLLATFLRESSRHGRQRSSTTVKQHIDIFLHSYLPSGRGPRSVKEDVLDCPFIDLELVQVIGERKSSSGRRERSSCSTAPSTRPRRS